MLGFSFLLVTLLLLLDQNQKSRKDRFSAGTAFIATGPIPEAPENRRSPQFSGAMPSVNILVLMGPGAALSAPNGAPSFPDSSPAPLMAPQKRCQKRMALSNALARCNSLLAGRF
jgi:hypothetical protein